MDVVVSSCRSVVDVDGACASTTLRVFYEAGAGLGLWLMLWFGGRLQWQGTVLWSLGHIWGSLVRIMELSSVSKPFYDEF